jgi:hypothetical protein
MANGSNRLMSDEASVNIGALQQRVYGLESGQRALADGLSNLSSRVETLFAGLATKIEDRSRPQYPLLISIGVFGLAVLTSVGWLAYAPIRESQTDLKSGLVELAKAFGAAGERFVTIRELDGRAARTTSDLIRINADIKAIEEVTVPRVEQAERMRSVDAHFVNQQRQLDDIKKAFGDTFSLRDALIQMQRRIDMLESKRPSS